MYFFLKIDSLVQILLRKDLLLDIGNSDQDMTCGFQDIYFKIIIFTGSWTNGKTHKQCTL